ncbi:glycerate kinase type-2 family protein [Zemynaea arenosa]|nr:glycerate kinase [Massilia arenosa]
MPAVPPLPLPPRELLQHLFETAVAAVDPLRIIGPHLPPRPRGRIVVIGAGKASARMAQGVEQHYGSGVEGLVVTRYGHGAPTRQIEIIEAGHPVPDEASETAAHRILDTVRGLTEDDLVLCLMSGGGSALLSLPAPGLSVTEKRAIHKQLLRCGAPIADMNCVRRHLSAVKGGRLALACHPARVVTLVVSDVPGDDPAVVASGPTLPDGSTAAAARAILARYAIPVSPAVEAVLADPTLAAPNSDDARLARNSVTVIASAQAALDAAAAAAREAGYTPLILSNSLEGEAREVALVHAGIARQVRQHGQPLAAPCVILSGGETTVTVRGTGRGGRNAEFLLALASALDGAPGVHAIACDTDGIDGTEDNAGALIDPGTLVRSRFDARELLANNDGYSFFAALDDLVITGPTRTNVNDFRAILIDRA